MQGRKITAPTRQEVIEICPGLQASPTEVRDWFASYLAYRGIPREKSEKFFWRGIELHRASYGTLVDAFKQHCGTLDWEAEILAYDVYTIVEVSLNRTEPNRTELAPCIIELFYAYRPLVRS